MFSSLCYRPSWVNPLSVTLVASWVVATTPSQEYLAPGRLGPKEHYEYHWTVALLKTFTLQLFTVLEQRSI